MRLLEFGRVLRARWLVVVVCTLLGAAGAIAATLLTTPQYESAVSLYVSARAETGNASSAYDASQLSTQRISSYAQLATDPRVLDPVVSRLQLPLSSSELAGDVTATSAPDTVILSITVRYPSPQLAALIADQVSGELITTVDQLERPAGSQGVAPVGLSLVRPAVPSPAPVSPKPVVNVVLGLVLGLAVGVGIAFARQALDTSIKSPRQLRDLLDVPVLGEIPRDDGPEAEVLTVRGRSNAPRPEFFRKLRTTLRFVRVDDPPRVLLVTSAMAGEGKSATTANLAIAMAEAGERVLVIEGDLRLPQLATYLGVVDEIGVTSVLSGDLELPAAVQTVHRGHFEVLAAGPIPPNPAEMLGSRAMARLIVDVRTRYDRVLVDTPPLLPVADTAAIGHHTDGALLVVRYGETRSQDVEAAAETLTAADTLLLGTILVGTPPRPSSYTPYHRDGAARGARPRQRADREESEVTPAPRTEPDPEPVTDVVGLALTTDRPASGTVRMSPRYTPLVSPSSTAEPHPSPGTTSSTQHAEPVPDGTAGADGAESAHGEGDEVGPGSGGDEESETESSSRSSTSESASTADSANDRTENEDPVRTPTPRPRRAAALAARRTGAPTSSSPAVDTVTDPVP